MTLKAHDGDRGNPRPVIYSLESSEYYTLPDDDQRLFLELH